MHKYKIWFSFLLKKINILSIKYLKFFKEKKHVFSLFKESI